MKLINLKKNTWEVLGRLETGEGSYAVKKWFLEQPSKRIMGQIPASSPAYILGSSWHFWPFLIQFQLPW